MFNTTNATPNGANDIKFQVFSGGIYKSHPKSRIINMKMESDLADEMFSDEPCIGDEKIVVLQVVWAFNDYIFVEFVNKDDYEAENVVFYPNNSQKHGDE